MIRVLHIIGSLERAGVETFVMNLYRTIDRNKVQFDFAIYNKPTENSYAKEVSDLGGKIFLIPSKEKSIVKCFLTITNIVKNNEYDIVWRHTSSCIGGMDLFAAFRGGAKKRILHSHSSRRFGVEKYIHFFLRPFCKAISTQNVACGQNAGKWMFGNANYEIMPNGIDTQRFKYSDSVRKEYRRELGIENKTVIGSVGRFEEVKNYKFLIEVFNNWVKNRTDSVLIMVGTGTQEDDCKKLAEKYGIADKILFLGTRSDVAQILQAIDVFVMTSIYEGFPVILIEAQASGLPCVISGSVSRETDLIGTATYVSLQAGIEKWCEAIDSNLGTRIRNGDEILIERGYDIAQITKRVEKIILGN